MCQLAPEGIVQPLEIKSGSQVLGNEFKNFFPEISSGVVLGIVANRKNLQAK